MRKMRRYRRPHGLKGNVTALHIEPSVRKYDNVSTGLALQHGVQRHLRNADTRYTEDSDCTQQMPQRACGPRTRAHCSRGYQPETQ